MIPICEERGVVEHIFIVFLEVEFNLLPSMAEDQECTYELSMGAERLMHGTFQGPTLYPCGIEKTSALTRIWAMVDAIRASSSTKSYQRGKTMILSTSMCSSCGLEYRRWWLSPFHMASNSAARAAVRVFSLTRTHGKFWVRVHQL